GGGGWGGWGGWSRFAVMGGVLSCRPFLGVPSAMMTNPPRPLPMSISVRNRSPLPYIFISNFMSGPAVLVTPARIDFAFSAFSIALLKAAAADWPGDQRTTPRATRAA